MSCPLHDCWGLSSSHGWFTQLIDLIQAEPMKFSLPGIYMGNEEARDCNRWNWATHPRVPERMGTTAAAGIPEWYSFLLSQRFTNLETIRTMGRSVCDMSVLTHSFSLLPWTPRYPTISILYFFFSFFFFFPPSFLARIRCKSESYLQWKNFS